jgi:VWFA-related protein
MIRRGRRQAVATTTALVMLIGAVVAVHARRQQTPPPQDQERRMFSARSDVVRLDILVTVGDKALLGLKAEDFRISDNGVVQQPDFVSFDQLPLNVIFAFDVSGSMVGQRLDDLRAAGHGVLEQLREDDRAALVNFSEVVSLGTDLTPDLKRVGAALDAGRAVGLTSLVDATFSGLMLGGTDSGRSVMFVFSDGMDTSSWLQPSAVINAAKRANVTIFGLTVGKTQGTFLRDLAQFTGGDVVEVQSTKDLKATFVRLLTEYRQRYLVGYTPTGVSATGWHQIEVTVPRRANTIVKTRAGYQAK